MTNEEAKTKATEYADAVAYKRMIDRYYRGYTVTPTTNFNDYNPVNVGWDVTLTDADGEKTLKELKSRSKKYRFFSHIKDLRLTGYKLDNLRDEAERQGCKAEIVGIYPYDNVIVTWPADGEYEETIQYTKKFEYGEDSDKIEQKAYILPFDMAEKYVVDMSDFDDNYQKAYNKYKKAVTDDAEGV